MYHHLGTSAWAMDRVRNAVRIVHTVGVDDTTLRVAIDELRRLCFSAGTNEPLIQNAIFNQNALERVIELATPGHSDAVRASALDCLIELCFNNPSISAAVGKNKPHIECIVATMADENTPLELRSLALTSTINLAGNSWMSHPNLVPLIPIVVRFVREKPTEEAMMRGVIFLNNLAYNSEMHPTLKSLNAVPALVDVMQQHHSNLAFVSSLAVANIDSHNEVFSGGTAPHITLQIVEAFSRVIEGQDYPPESKMYGQAWKMAMTISRMCTNKAVRHNLREAGFLNQLRRALELTHPNHARVVEYCLETLWLLSVDESS